ncbi:ribonuclease H-like domain-containing protein [Phyllosticta citribraziliensis]|uniref:ribonuclease H n=1 Tax=Phyllosticta citribraziliensis TaxID=989973 RepID=A0ABR1L1P1_9PEZI
MPRNPEHEITGRLFQPCAEAEALTPTEQIRACPECGLFFFHCCAHPDTICHQRSVVFIDGACTNNGQNDAAAGYGAAVGVREDQQLSQQFGYAVVTTKQRADLIGAVLGIDQGESWWRRERAHQRQRGAQHHEKKELIIATDSEYVIKVSTETLPRWKQNGFATPDGRGPANADLFMQIDSRVERMHDVLAVGFMHISRELNGLAASLAQRGVEVHREWQEMERAKMPAYGAFDAL